MKRTDYILIYDDKCPLCAAYTKAFVNCGILSADGRRNFSTINDEVLNYIDLTRACNEIPLIDTRNRRIFYGIDALLELLGTRLPLIKLVGTWKPIHWLLQKLYALISYNRKVIVATRCGKGSFDCSPDFNYNWRYLFMFLFISFNTWALFPVNTYVFANSFLDSSDPAKLQALHFGLVTINLVLALTRGRRQGTEYLGQVNMLATITMLSLLTFAIINKYLISSIALNNTGLFLISILIAHEYKRRMQFAGIFKLNYVTTINWLSILTFIIILYAKW